MEKSKNILAPILLVLLIIVGGMAISFYRELSTLKQNPQKIAQDQNQALLKEVGQLIVLPEGETPTVATVSDPSKLKDQPFFAKAKVGDKVLIYTNARKAILYSPADHIIVEVAPLTIGQSAPVAPAPTPAPAATSTKPVKK